MHKRVRQRDAALRFDSGGAKRDDSDLVFNQCVDGVGDFSSDHKDGIVQLRFVILIAGQKFPRLFSRKIGVSNPQGLGEFLSRLFKIIFRAILADLGEALNEVIAFRRKD